MNELRKKFFTVFSIVIIIWYHVSLIFFFSLPMLEKTNQLVESYVNNHLDEIIGFVALGLAMNALRVLFLLKLYRKKQKLRFFQELAIGFLSFLPFYSASIYKKQIVRIN